MPLGLLREAEPLAAQFDGWLLEDVLGPPLGSGYANDILAYQMVVSRELESSANSSNWHLLGCAKVELIERLWAFATGMPLQGRGFGVHFADAADPPGWTSNVDEVDVRLTRAQGEVLYGKMSVETLHWRQAIALPVSQLLPVLTAYQSARDVIRELVDLHFAAHSTSRFGRAFLFSKGLDIVRGGLSIQESEKALPEAVRAVLPRPLKWYFAMANTRRETRHPITKVPQVSLHPPMTQEERLLFLEGADLVIRSHVCSTLGVALIIPDGASDP